MKGKSLLFLLALVAGLGAYIYFEIQRPAEKKAAEGPGDKLFTWKKDELMGFSIEASGTKLELAQEGNRWRLTSPVKDLATEMKVTNLINALEKFKSTKVLKSKKYEDFGLEAPRVTLTLHRATEPRDLKIKLGQQNPTSSGTYALVGDQGEVHLATIDLDYLSTQRPDDFREMKLTTVAPEDYEKVSISQLGKSMSFKKTEKGWEMLAPYTLPVDQEMVRSHIEKISLIRANTFVETNAPKLPAAEITAVVGFKEGVQDQRTDKNDPRPKGFEVSLYRAKPPKGKEELYYAKGDKTPLATISKFHFENLQKTAEEFVLRTFDDFLVTDVETIDLKKPGLAPVSILRKSPTSYEVTSGKETKPGATKPIDDALAALRGMRALKFIEIAKTAPKGTASLDLTMTLKNKENRRFVLNQKKSEFDLYVFKGNQWLHYVASRDILKLENFEFKALTEVPVPATPAVDSKTTPVPHELMNPDKQSSTKEKK